MTCHFLYRFGKVEDAVVMYDKKTGRSRGFGFITYDNPEVVRKVRYAFSLGTSSRRFSTARECLRFSPKRPDLFRAAVLPLISLLVVSSF